MTELNFDSTVVEPTGKFTPIPMDDYLAIITDSEMKDTKKGDGKYLLLTYEVIEGEFKGRKIFETLNLINSNQTAVEIAQRALSAVCRATGVLHPKDSSELHGNPLVISVGIRAGSNGFDEKNVIKGYSRVDGKELKDVTDASAPVKGAPVIGGDKKLKPWERKK
jgi:hypothetical protein